MCDVVGLGGYGPYQYGTWFSSSKCGEVPYGTNSGQERCAKGRKLE